MELKRKKMPPSELSVLGSYETNIAQFMPRGGDYYLGYKGNNEKWLLINGFHVANQKSFEQFGDEPTEDILRQIFEIKPENIFKLNVFGTDLDEIVRPIGFPYILVNDYSKSAIMLNKMKEAYPEANESYDLMSDYIKNKINSEKALKLDPDYICKKLENTLLNHWNHPLSTHSVIFKYFLQFLIYYRLSILYNKKAFLSSASKF